MSEGRSCATVLFSSRVHAGQRMCHPMENPNRYLTRPELSLDSKSAQKGQRPLCPIASPNVWHSGASPILNANWRRVRAVDRPASQTIKEKFVRATCQDVT